MYAYEGDGGLPEEVTEGKVVSEIITARPGDEDFGGRLGSSARYRLDRDGYIPFTKTVAGEDDDTPVTVYLHRKRELPEGQGTLYGFSLAVPHRREHNTEVRQKVKDKIEDTVNFVREIEPDYLDLNEGLMGLLPRTKPGIYRHSIPDDEMEKMEEERELEDLQRVIPPASGRGVAR